MSLKYNGKGFIPTIPARDLTDAEVEEFGNQLRSTLDEKDPRRSMSNADLLMNTGVYEVAVVQPVSPSKKAKESDQ